MGHWLGQMELGACSSGLHRRFSTLVVFLFDVPVKITSIQLFIELYSINSVLVIGHRGSRGALIQTENRSICENDVTGIWYGYPAFL